MDDPDRCPKCHYPLEIGDWPYCNPLGGPHGKGAPAVVDDTIIGGEWSENMGHKPVYYDSKSEKRRLMKAHNVEPFVRHVGRPGSDKSDKTTRWI